VTQAVSVCQYAARPPTPAWETDPVSVSSCSVVRVMGREAGFCVSSELDLDRVTWLWHALWMGLVRALGYLID